MGWACCPTGSRGWVERVQVDSWLALFVVTTNISHITTTTTSIRSRNRAVADRLRARGCHSTLVNRTQEPEDLEEKTKVLDTKMMKLAHELAKNGTRPNNFFQSDKLPHEIAVTRPIAPWDNVLDMQGNPPPFSSEKR
jgi:hypothetical protein